ncbi:SPOR domain-containing protein [Oceanithermus sp.]
MRWLRDNWIDALIFTVFAITVVGIVLFLTGVNPFKPKAPAVSTGAVPAAGGVVEQVEQQAPAGQQPATEAPAENKQAPAVTVVPLLPGSNESPATGSGGEQPAAKAGTAVSSPPASGGGGQSASAGKPAASIKLPAGPEEGIFRVSVGAFRNPDNALALAEKLKRQGFPVRLEPVGKVTRVVVGPYSTRSSAAEAAAKLASYDPQVYRGDTPAPEGIYLQVGAYKKLSSAQGLVEKLRSAGIGPVVFYYQNPWLKVWVGPVAPEKVDQLKQRLQDLGLQAVEVR